MNLSRFALFFLVLLAFLVGGGILAADSIAKAAVEKGGTQVLGVETRLEKASVGLFSGQFGLQGLSVANAPGFSEPTFLEVDSAQLEVGLRSLMEDTVSAPLLALDGARMTLESQGSDTNYGVLLDNLEDARPEDSGDQDVQADRAASKSFVVGRIEIRNVELNLAVGLLGLETGATARVPEILVEDLDSREFTLEELIAFVVETILAHASELDTSTIPADIAADLGRQLEELVELELGDIEGLENLPELGKEGIEKAGEALKGLFGD